MIIIVTGLSGSGKTTLLKEARIPNTIYADDYIKEMFYKSGTEVYNKIKESFGPRVVDRKSVITSELGKIVFKDRDRLNELNTIVTPYIRSWLKSIKYKVVIEMAAYINNKQFFEDLVDKVILVTKEEPLIDKKFTYMDGKMQPISKRDIKPDYVLSNDGSIEEGAAKLKELYFSIVK